MGTSVPPEILAAFKRDDLNTHRAYNAPLGKVLKQSGLNDVLPFNAII